MTGSDGGKPAVAGGLARHTPVLGPAALGFLAIKDGGVYIDGTFGAGGYTRSLLAAADCRVISIDRDQSAIARGAGLVESAGGRLELVQSRFSALDDIARQSGHDSVDGVVLDLGVSSMQLDEAERGFSFRNDGPLDMRMGADAYPSAISPMSFSCSERSGIRAPSPAPSLPSGRKNRSKPPANSRPSLRASCAASPARSIRRRARSRRCGCS